MLRRIPGRLLAAAGAPRWLSSVLVGGIGAGVRAVVALVPLIFVISFALSYLDQWGWMARAARALGVLGASGLPTAAPLLAGFGCTVPAVLTLRAPSIEARRGFRPVRGAAFLMQRQAFGLRGVRRRPTSRSWWCCRCTWSGCCSPPARPRC